MDLDKYFLPNARKESTDNDKKDEKSLNGFKKIQGQRRWTTKSVAWRQSKRDKQAEIPLFEATLASFTGAIQILMESDVHIWPPKTKSDIYLHLMSIELVHINGYTTFAQQRAEEMASLGYTNYLHELKVEYEDHDSMYYCDQNDDDHDDYDDDENDDDAENDAKGDTKDEIDSSYDVNLTDDDDNDIVFIHTKTVRHFLFHEDIGNRLKKCRHLLYCQLLHVLCRIKIAPLIEFPYDPDETWPIVGQDNNKQQIAPYAHYTDVPLVLFVLLPIILDYAISADIQTLDLRSGIVDLLVDGDDNESVKLITMGNSYENNNIDLLILELNAEYRRQYHYQQLSLAITNVQRFTTILRQKYSWDPYDSLFDGPDFVSESEFYEKTVSEPFHPFETFLSTRKSPPK